MRDLFGRRIEFKPIEDFDEDEIWETADGKRIPIPYLSDRHLKNAIRRTEELLSDALDMYDFASETDRAWIMGKVEELEDILSVLNDEVERRRKEKVIVREIGNPYYED